MKGVWGNPSLAKIQRNTSKKTPKNKDNGLDILAIALASTNPLIKRKLDTTNSKLGEVEKNDSEQFGSYNKYNIQTRATAFPSIPLMSSETFL